MGRGRQKAKNTKVARELKYFSPATDFTSLEAELATKAQSEELYEDKWADLYEDDEDGESDVAASDDERSADQDER